MAVITSVARVLRCFDTHQELSVARLTEELELPRSTVSRLMQDMAKVGFLEQDPATRRYRPGPLLLAGARHHRASVDFVELACGALDELVDRFGHTGFVMGLDGANVVTIKARLGTRAIRVQTTDHLIGGPAYLRSAGRALLARLDDDTVRRLHPGEFEAIAPTVPQTIEELLARLGTVRQRRVAEAYNEAIPGVGGLAVAIGSEGEEPIAINITFAADLVRTRERKEIAAALLETGHRLGARVGDPAWRAPARARGPAGGRDGSPPDPRPRR